MIHNNEHQNFLMAYPFRYFTLDTIQNSLLNAVANYSYQIIELQKEVEALKAYRVEADIKCKKCGYSRNA